MDKKIIVTGVTGQDGSYMVDFLLENTSHNIYGMIRRSAKPDFSNLKNVPGVLSYPHLGTYGWALVWKNSLIDHEYAGRIFYVYIYTKDKTFEKRIDHFIEYCL
jgi:nucleoside-diphosphate-sugar epimerase